MDGTRDLHDSELEAVLEEQLASREQPEFVRGCAATAGACATMLYAHIDANFGGHANREHAAGLRKLADDMLRLGAR